MAFKAKTGVDRYKSPTVQDGVRAAIKNELVGLSIKIPKQKRIAFKAKATMNNENMQDILLNAIDKYIEN